MKKTLLVCLALLSLMLVFTACGEDETPPPSNPGLYDEDNNLVATWDELVTTYGMKVDVDYVDYANKNNNTSAPYYVLTEKKSLKNGTKLVIGDVSKIGNNAFQDTRLTYIVLSDSVTSIGDRAFDGCKKLKTITLSNGLTSIGRSAFQFCTSLKSITIPDGITTLSDGMFWNCFELKSITLPDTLTSIGDSAIYGCKRITSITIPDSVTSIGESAFGDCDSLKSVKIPDSLVSIGEKAFQGCPKIKSITIPDSVVSIGENAFQGCESLSYKKYGKGKYLGNQENPYLVLIKVTDKSITSYDVHPDTKLIYCNAFKDLQKITSITIPDGVTSIGKYAFYNCYSLKNISIPDSVRFIDYDAFYACDRLTYTTYDNANYLGNESNPYLVLLTATDTSISSCTIHPNTRVIYGNAFYHCRRLADITIPDSVTSIGDSAFYDCRRLADITIPDSVTSIGNDAFLCCESLESITISNGVTSIGESAFSNCKSLTSITFDGTTAEWNAIEKGSYWKDQVPAKQVVCSDGTVTIY